MKKFMKTIFDVLLFLMVSMIAGIFIGKIFDFINDQSVYFGLIFIIIIIFIIVKSIHKDLNGLTIFDKIFESKIFKNEHTKIYEEQLQWLYNDPEKEGWYVVNYNFVNNNDKKDYYQVCYFDGEEIGWIIDNDIKNIKCYYDEKFDSSSQAVIWMKQNIK